jgi:hypothetical protein
MSKQDRQAVRTAVDVEIKYGLGKQKSSQGLSAKQEERINQLSQTIQQYTNKTNGYIDELNDEVGELETAVGEANAKIKDLEDNQAISPTITVTEIEGGHKVTIIDVDGAETINVMDGVDGEDGKDGQNGEDGFSPTVDIIEITGGHRVTITDKDGTKSFDVMDGEGGGTGGADGEDGYSPTVDVTEIEGGHRVTVTDVNGTESFDVMNGVDGNDGYTPVKGVDYFDGVNGKDGYTPVKGVDYFDGVDGKDGTEIFGALTNVASNTDMNNLLIPGAFSISSNAIAETIANLPLKVAGRVFVSSAIGSAVASSGYAALRQTFIPYQTRYPTFERDISRNSSNALSYGSWIPTSLNGQKILWSGYSQMGNGVKINLTEKISQQPNGITLIFSYVQDNGSVADYYYSHHRIDKAFVSAKNGASSQFFMNMYNFAVVGSKLLYIYDDRIEGYSGNTTTGTASGITFYNNRWMLRYVLGV